MLPLRQLMLPMDILRHADVYVSLPLIRCRYAYAIDIATPPRRFSRA